jgi:hypothetical protein
VYLILNNSKAFLVKEFEETNSGFNFDKYIEIKRKIFYTTDEIEGLKQIFKLCEIEKEAYFLPHTDINGTIYIHKL